MLKVLYICENHSHIKKSTKNLIFSMDINLALDSNTDNWVLTTEVTGDHKTAKYHEMNEARSVIFT